MDLQNKVDRKKCSLCMKCTEICPNRAFLKVGQELTVEEVIAEVEKDLPFYGEEGGVTLSGGEPFYQPEFTLNILRGCKERGITTVLDTTAYTEKENIEEALGYTDLFLLDIKHMDPQKHKEGTGVSNETILENAKLIAQKGKVRISLPLIPDYNDDPDNLVRTAEFVKELGIEWIDINPLHRLGASKYEYLGMKSPYSSFRDLSKEEIRQVRSLLESFGLKTTVGRMM
ncbi:MAG TPA: glycyl-radical enzyme activating protein [Peptococcaceae bacterium]|nr:glycyl-radical enzyme activating protein [Peptococcaceae bacterium]